MRVSSTRLLERARCRDQEAWKRLVCLYAPLIRHWCQAQGVGGADAEDVQQEVFKAVVREALVARLVEFRGRIDQFQGSSFELVRLVFKTWWEKIGATPISGIPKLILSEARNFPEIARFYVDEVVHPGHDYVGRATTTIGEEKAGNPLVREHDRAALVARLAGNAAPPANEQSGPAIDIKV